MSRQFRYRVAALVLGGLLLGGPLAASGTAIAGQVRPAPAGDSGHQVIFGGGGMFGLSCRSHPDPEVMTVPAETTVRVVNRTGHRAKLRLGGHGKGMLPDNQSTEVIFRRGTTALTLTPTCAHGHDVTPAMVTAQPSAHATVPDPDPAPNPSADDSSASAGDPTDSSGPSDSHPNDTISPPARSHRPTSAAGRPATTRSHARHSAAKAQGMPPGGRRIRVKSKVKSVSGTARAANPTLSTVPLDAKNVPVPGVPEPDLDSPPTDAGPAAVSVPATEIAAAEPVAALEPMPAQEPIGLLAAVAAVCALGVGIAAIRAFVSQRANRSKMA